MIESFVALDLETTGVNSSTDRIIEIGLQCVINGEVVREYNQLVNPGRKLESRITELTGISDEMLVGKPGIEQIIPEVIEMIGDLPLLGHNIIFDYGFLKKAALTSGFTFDKKGIDTLKIARVLLPQLEKKNLSVLCDYFDIDTGNSHRALDDANSARLLYYKLHEIKPDYEAFDVPTQLVLNIKKEVPITLPQKKYLNDLLKYHNITLDEDIEMMSKSRASKVIDGIISTHGRIL